MARKKHDPINAGNTIFQWDDDDICNGGYIRYMLIDTSKPEYCHGSDDWKKSDGTYEETSPSYIEVSIDDINVDAEYEDNSFYEDFGLGPERCDPGSGYAMTDSRFEKSLIYYISDCETSREEFMEQLNINEDEMKEIEQKLFNDADSLVDDYIADNWDRFCPDEPCRDECPDENW